MHLLQPDLHSRRAFLKRAGQLAFSGTSLPVALNLATLSEAAAFNNPGDYKALVCVFLYGANDYANTVVTYDNPSYAQYLAIRGAFSASGGLALPQSDLATTLLVPSAAPVDSLGASRQFAFNPAMTRLTNLFNSGQVAVQLNVGPLIAPLTRDQYNSTDHKSYPRPPQLFSHNDQQSIWQSSSPEGAKVGWGGNIGDLALSSNTAASFTCINATGNAVFLSGDQALAYQVTTGGAVRINAAYVNAANVTNSTYGSTKLTTALRGLIQQSRKHTMENEYNRVVARSIAAEGSVTAALATTTSSTFAFPSGNSLADQLKVVARLISARAVLGAQRQVFLVSLGGFDMHDYLARDHGGFRDSGNNITAGLLGKVSDAMAAFYDATVAMGVADKVTTFTASDFGRTLASNGDGSDHGWGSHHIVMGGAVRGQRFYGIAPPVSVSDAKVGNAYRPENQWHVGQGRLLPTTSVAQFGATMARWFGVAESEMNSVFPSIGRFEGSYAKGYLGFLG